MLSLPKPRGLIQCFLSLYFIHKPGKASSLGDNTQTGRAFHFFWSHIGSENVFWPLLLDFNMRNPLNGDLCWNVTFLLAPLLQTLDTWPRSRLSLLILLGLPLNTYIFGSISATLELELAATKSFVCLRVRSSIRVCTSSNQVLYSHASVLLLETVAT